MAIRTQSGSITARAVRALPCVADLIMSRRRLFGAALLALACAQPARAQDVNIVLPVAEIEARLQEQPFRVLDWRGSRKEADRTQRTTLAFEDSAALIVKWANAPANGSLYNNEPRYEVAAYRIQKLFLDEPYYVVPPTVVRAMPVAFVREQMSETRPTFREAPGSVLVTLQYWLSAVSPDGFWDERRARTDSVYARYIANFNILTYVIHHNDANAGNYLISAHAGHPRVFSVDNGVSFRANESTRGFEWRDMRVERLPRSTIDRLATITREQLEEMLGVLLEYEIRDGELVAVTPGANLSPNRGVRRTAERIQFGLTAREIREVDHRIRTLVRQANGRGFTLF
jgi:hypothetical protein